MNIGFFYKTLEAYDAHIKPFIEKSPNEDFKFYVFHLNQIYAPEYHNTAIHCPTFELTGNQKIAHTLIACELDFLVFFNPGHIYSLFLIDLCKQLSIVPIYFQHGMSLDLASFDLKSLNQNKSFSRKIISLKKYLFFYLSICVNLFFFKKRWLVLKHLLTKSSYLFTHIFNKDKMYKLPKYGLKGVHCDYAFVYGNNDKDYLIKSMNMNPENIIISGYPFLSPTINRFLKRSEKRVLYLTNPYRATGILPITLDDEREFYLSMYNQVKMAGYELDIKLHPKDDLEIIQGYFKGCDNVRIYKDKNLADLTLAASVVISDFSTALFYAIRYYKPIIILKSDYFESYPFDYTKHGIGIKSELNNINIVIKGTETLEPARKNNYKKFLTNFLLEQGNKSAYDRFYSTLVRIKQK